MNELALFAGAGGGILGGYLLGWRTVCAVERDAHAAAVLAQRQNDGILKAFPIWSDITTFDGRPWRGIVDVISGGFPCTDISCAGRGEGITGANSGLWKEMARIIREVRPLYVFVENSPILTSRGLGTVLGDLAEAGYDAKWRCLSAAECGAHHLRDRIWIVANNARERCREKGEFRYDQSAQWTTRSSTATSNPDSTGCEGSKGSGQVEECIGERTSNNSDSGTGKLQKWPTEPGVVRMVHGMASTLDVTDRIKELGNGQVSRVAATAFNLLR